MDAALAFLAEDHELNRKAVEVYAPSFDAHEKASILQHGMHYRGIYWLPLHEEKQY